MQTEAVKQIGEFVEKVQIVEKGIEDKIQNLSPSVVRDLEQSYELESDEALAACDRANIQVLVDKAREFTEKHLFYQLNQATEAALAEIKAFHNLHRSKGHSLPSTVFDDFRSFLEKHEASLADLRAGVEALEEITQYSDFSKTNSLAKWADGLERFGDALEDNLPFFDFDTLEALEPLLYEVIQQTRKKSSNLKTRENKRERFRIRIRNAAGFLARLIESLREESEAEDQEIMAAISTANHPAFFEG
ncbi:hypothetical protein IQ250_29295 [Pseudanabaenaceae cyanobacterium LEGE 13415]|nr:hypothetical protein [Pseudanabaenaceae cyanobacterium LEGE 13415]